MGKVKDFFSMTRRERVGAFVVAALLCVALLLVWLSRAAGSQGPRPVDDSLRTVVRSFDSTAHSISLQPPAKATKRKVKPKTKKKAGSKKSRRKSKGGSDEAPQGHDRSLDELPRY